MIRHLLLCFCVTIGLSMPILQAQEKFLGKNADAWVVELKANADAKARRSAAFALGKLGRNASAAMPALKAAFGQEQEAMVREAILSALGEICLADAAARKDQGLEKLFLSALRETDPRLRRSGVFALGCLASKSDETRLALERALAHDKDAGVRQNAASALIQFGDEALPALARGLRDTDAHVQRGAARALLQCSDGDKVRKLLKDLLALCTHENAEVRRAGLNVLVRIVDANDRDAIPMLRAVLDDKDIENRRNAALALSNIGGEDAAVALPVLLDAAKNGGADLRPQAVLAIRNIGPAAAAAVPDLILFLQTDKDVKVREYAAIALGGVANKAEKAVPILGKKIQDASEASDVRVECAMALARIGKVPVARDVAPTLLDVLRNPKQEIKVRERSVWALRIHGVDLRNIDGTKAAFTQVLKEPLTKHNKMLRYDCAYMLGMIWQMEAPDATLDVLSEFLRDPTIKIYLGTSVGVVPKDPEFKGGTTKVQEKGLGDGRVMACDALRMMGPGRYAGRADIMKQLRVLAADTTLDPALRKQAVELHNKGGQ